MSCPTWCQKMTTDESNGPNTSQNHGKLLNFFLVVTGVTGGAHEELIIKLQHKGQTQKKSLEESDYILAFCPSPSRTGTDVMEAMGKIPPGKPVILVVMHHRHDVEARLDDSSKHVTRDDVLTVDTLFWEGEFLKCSHNEEAFSKVQQKVGTLARGQSPTKEKEDQPICDSEPSSFNYRSIPEPSTG